MIDANTKIRNSIFNIISEVYASWLYFIKDVEGVEKL